MSTMQRPKFVTLTQMARREPLGQSIARLLRAFSRLRRYAVWKQCVSGGIYVVEITRHPKRLHWHVHLHLVMDSEYLSQAWLADTWEKITGDSRIVHIRAAKPSDAKYVAKYVSKGGESALEPWELWPYLDEIAGRRLVAAFGNQERLFAREAQSEYAIVGTLENVVSWAQSGDEVARGILDSLIERYARYLIDGTKPPPAPEIPPCNWQDLGPPHANAGPGKRSFAPYREGLGYDLADRASRRARWNNITYSDLDK